MAHRLRAAEVLDMPTHHLMRLEMRTLALQVYTIGMLPLVCADRI
jgi:hypothetical protein